jgi:hypothetical protein
VKCLAFCYSILGSPRPASSELALIFGMQSYSTLLPEMARAFLRHAYGCFYRDFSNVDTKGRRFIWEFTYKSALTSFSYATTRYARQLKVLYASRLYSTLNGVAPEEARTKYAAIINIEHSGAWALTAPFQRAIDAAAAAAQAR